MSMLRGRAPTPHYFPLNLFLPPIDLSDPYTFLALKRGIMRTFVLTEYIQFKPVFAVATLLLKQFGWYEEGHLSVRNGYTWVALLYSALLGADRHVCILGTLCTHGVLAVFPA